MEPVHGGRFHSPRIPDFINQQDGSCDRRHSSDSGIPFPETKRNDALLVILHGSISLYLEGVHLPMASSSFRLALSMRQAPTISSQYYFLIHFLMHLSIRRLKAEFTNESCHNYNY